MRVARFINIFRFSVSAPFSRGAQKRGVRFQGRGTPFPGGTEKDFPKGEGRASGKSFLGGPETRRAAIAEAEARRSAERGNYPEAKPERTGQKWKEPNRESLRIISAPTEQQTSSTERHVHDQSAPVSGRSSVDGRSQRTCCCWVGIPQIGGVTRLPERHVVDARGVRMRRERKCG